MADVIPGAGEPIGDPAAGLVATITVGMDGRVYFHDLTPALMPVAAALCPGDPVLTRRIALIEGPLANRNEPNQAR